MKPVLDGIETLGKRISSRNDRKSRERELSGRAIDMIEAFDGGDDRAAFLALLVQQLTGSVHGWWQGSISAAHQRKLFGKVIGKGSFVIDGRTEEVRHNVSVGFGQDFDTTWSKKWREL